MPSSEIALSRLAPTETDADFIPEHDEQEGAFDAFPPDRPLGYLVDIQARCTANKIGDSFPVQLLLEVGSYDLEIIAKARTFKLAERSEGTPIRLRIGLRYCFVRYSERGVSIDLTSKYQVRSRDVVKKYTEKRNRSGLSGFDIGVGVEGKLPAAPSGLGAQGKANAKFGRSGSIDVESTTEIRSEPYDVQAVPGGWQIGNADSINRLHGRYFDIPSPEVADTFRAQFKRGETNGRIVLTVTVRDGFHIERLDGSEPTKDEKKKAESLMRDAVAALRIEKQLDITTDSNESWFGEVGIARQVCQVRRAASQASPPAVALLIEENKTSNVLRSAANRSRRLLSKILHSPASEE